MGFWEVKRLHGRWPGWDAILLQAAAGADAGGK